MKLIYAHIPLKLSNAPYLSVLSFFFSLSFSLFLPVTRCTFFLCNKSEINVFWKIYDFRNGEWFTIYMRLMLWFEWLTTPFQPLLPTASSLNVLFVSIMKRESGYGFYLIIGNRQSFDRGMVAVQWSFHFDQLLLSYYGFVYIESNRRSYTKPIFIIASFRSSPKFFLSSITYIHK